jgi:hypothetical protein
VSSVEKSQRPVPNPQTSWVKSGEVVICGPEGNPPGLQKLFIWAGNDGAQIDSTAAAKVARNRHPAERDDRGVSGKGRCGFSDPVVPETGMERGNLFALNIGVLLVSRVSFMRFHFGLRQRG